MVAGHLQEKTTSLYYIVLSYTRTQTESERPWEATGLSVKRKRRKSRGFAGTSAEFHGSHRACGDPLRR